MLQDDGDLVIYDSANKDLWYSGTAVMTSNLLLRQLLITPISIVDKYDEASEPWKQMCSTFPCFTAVQFPSYATKVIDNIDGQLLIIDCQQVVIQLCKGWYGEKVANFLGCIGAEVGVHCRILGQLAQTLPLLQSLLFSPPKELPDLIRNNIDRLTDSDV